MKQAKWGRVLLTAALMATTGAAMAADKVDFGKREYDLKCASCHGRTGKGDGYYPPLLTVAPTNLTVITRRRTTGCFRSITSRSRSTDAVREGARAARKCRSGVVTSLAAGERYFDVPYFGDRR